MKKRIVAAVCLLLAVLCVSPIGTLAVEQKKTPNYKVAFFAFDCFNMQDENGKRSGYNYEMMQSIAKYLQCTFSYVGYDKSQTECLKLLDSGVIDLYTAAKKTPEREKNYIFSTHPSITSYTCMNVKVGNDSIVPGDYSTYEGIRVGLLKRHTYNGMFLDFVREKGFNCEIIYYETPTDLSNALVSDSVDATVNSYIRIPEDEKIIESFGETPYYVMALKENAGLVRRLDEAIDSMNIETPNWRAELYNKYYGTVESNLTLTAEEQSLLDEMRKNGDVIRAAMNPDNRPYSWFEDGKAKGIVAEVFMATAQQLDLEYEIVPVSTKKDYENMLRSGKVDIWIDMDDCYDSRFENGAYYKPTNSYLTTTTSVLRTRTAPEKIDKLVIFENCVEIKDIINSVWPNTKITVASSLAECKKMLIDNRVDGALLLSYTAQRIARDDLQNRLQVDIVPGGSVDLMMGINATRDVKFYGIWRKTLAEVSNKVTSGIVQDYLEQAGSSSFAAYLFDHPISFAIMCSGAVLLLLFFLLYFQSAKSKNKLEKSAAELAVALEDAKEATEAKQNFFSKMSHDIRTPLNVVLGMTQIAQKYKDNPEKLEHALGNVTKEGNYLLLMINSILDVNQLEHGTVELAKIAFNPADCLNESAYMLKTLAESKKQELTVQCDCADKVVLGDENRLKQILINIISNAIKYTGNEGHIALSLECLPQDRYRFTCTDDGIGMSEELIAHVCEEYIRAENSRVSKIEGTGLGMPVVKGFTELMGGTLTIKSKPDAGSTFSVEIPFPAASSNAREAVLHPVAESEINAANFAGKKVLLAEDNALNAEIATELLQGIGLTVDLAENGKICVERFEASEIGEYFAIFMDMQMPVTDGVEATILIRKSLREDKNLPIFAMTANTFTSDRLKCRDAGMDGYITKPINVKDIKTALVGIRKN